MSETTVFYAAKGGQGCTVTAAAYALSLAAADPSTLVHIVDATSSPGDVAAVLGLPSADHAGTVAGGVAVWSGAPDPHRVAARLAREGARVVVDAGTAPAGSDVDRVGYRRILVTRACYLALRRAVAALAPDGVVVVLEDGRSLGPDDVGSCLSGPVLAVLPYAPAIARAVDAGLLATRLPGAFRPLGGLEDSAVPR